MPMITNETIQEYRSKSFFLQPGQRVTQIDEAINFVKKRGFIFFWPITGITMPSLWTAVAGDRPVADAHDDPGHVTWGWKDSLLGQKRWYYAKVLRKKATIIDLDIVPNFYALSDNYGSPEDDYLTLYEQGRLTQEARIIYETILEEGPIDTVALRRATRLTSRESDHRFNRSLTELQTDFKILPIGVAQAGGWNYAFIYEIVARHYPELPNQAHSLKESHARQKLLELYFSSVGAAQIADIVKLFGWEPEQAESSVNKLVETGKLIRGLQADGQKGEWIALKDLV